jgi:hypothetical protein
MNKKYATFILFLIGLMSSGVHSAATDYQGSGGACVANGYGYCPSTGVCFEDQSLPTPDPTAASS